MSIIRADKCGPVASGAFLGAIRAEIRWPEWSLGGRAGLRGGPLSVMRNDVVPGRWEYDAWGVGHEHPNQQPVIRVIALHIAVVTGVLSSVSQGLIFYLAKSVHENATGVGTSKAARVLIRAYPG